MDKLQEFYSDNQMKEIVHNFLCQHLNKLALEKVYKREDVKGIPDAMLAIQDAFLAIDKLYAEPPKPKIQSNR